MIQALLFLFLAENPLASGGPLSANQAAFDVKAMHLVLTIDPSRKQIAGHADLELLVAPSGLDRIELDLLDQLKVNGIKHQGKQLAFTRDKHKLFISLPERQTGALKLRISYEGHPLEAARPPWDGGFNWSSTDSGAPWVGVSCQGTGSKVWYPCKEHPSDKIESLRLTITVPEPLFCAANGNLEKIAGAEPGWRTFHWQTQTPISTYNVSINIADYEKITRSLERNGKVLPVVFYVLKEYQKADQLPQDPRDYATKKNDLMDMALEYLNYFSNTFGEYPFETFKFVHTHYLGMEHQTINSYGNHFKIEDGYDFLLFHEMAHEWWGNKVTVADWADFWIHEGIGTYASGMYLEDTQGPEAAANFFRKARQSITNTQAVMPGKDMRGDEYTLDVYYKGAVMLHALRSLVGRETLDNILKSYAARPQNTYNRFADTNGFIAHAESVAGRKLDWFFNVYLFSPQLPKLKAQERDGALHLEWKPASFKMPLEVKTTLGHSSQMHRLRFPNGKALLPLKQGTAWEIDPQEWVYRAQ